MTRSEFDANRTLASNGATVGKFFHIPGKHQTRKARGFAALLYRFLGISF